MVSLYGRSHESTTKEGRDSANSGSTATKISEQRRDAQSSNRSYASSFFSRGGGNQRQTSFTSGSATTATTNTPTTPEEEATTMLTNVVTVAPDTTSTTDNDDGGGPHKRSTPTLFRRSSTMSSACSSGLSEIDRRRLLFPIQEISFRSLSTSDGESVAAAQSPPPLLLAPQTSATSVVSDSVASEWIPDSGDLDDDARAYDDCDSSIPTRHTGSVALRSFVSRCPSLPRAVRDDVESRRSRSSFDCVDCGRHLGRGRRQRRRRCANPRCGATLCRPCGTKWTLPASIDNDDDDDVRGHHHHCRGCFEGLSGTDLSRTFEVVEPPPRRGGARHDRPDTTLVLTHRYGAARGSLRPHAERLASLHGYRCVLVDLPGHGARVDEDGDARARVAAVREAVAVAAPPGSRVVLVASSSWGARTALRVLAEDDSERIAGLALDACDRVDVSLAATLARRIRDATVPRATRARRLARSRDPAVHAGGVFAPRDRDRPSDVVVPDRRRRPVLFLDGNRRLSAARSRRRRVLVERLGGEELVNTVVFEGGDDEDAAHDPRFFASWVDFTDSFVYHLPVDATTTTNTNTNTTDAGDETTAVALAPSVAI